MKMQKAVAHLMRAQEILGFGTNFSDLSSNLQTTIFDLSSDDLSSMFNLSSVCKLARTNYKENAQHAFRNCSHSFVIGKKERKSIYTQFLKESNCFRWHLDGSQNYRHNCLYPKSSKSSYCLPNLHTTPILHTRNHTKGSKRYWVQE